MKEIYYGLPAHGFLAEALNDRALLHEVVTLMRIVYFVADPGSKPERSRMRAHYGALLSEGALAPLICEARKRAGEGSQECRVFLAAELDGKNWTVLGG